MGMHLEEENTDKEGGTGWRYQCHWRHNWGIHSAPCHDSEGCSAGGEMLLPLQQPRALYLHLPIDEGIQNRSTFEPKGGDGAKEGSPDPPRKSDHAKGTPRRDTQGIGLCIQTHFLNSESLLDNRAHHAWFCSKLFPWFRTPLRSSGQMSHLCRPGECTYPIYGLCCHTGFSGWIKGCDHD